MNWVQFIINMLAGYDVSSTREKLEQSIAALEREKSDLANRVNELEASVTEYKEKNNTLSDELNVSNSIVEEQNQRASLVTSQLNAYKTNYAEEKKAKEELQAKVESVQSEKEELTNQVNVLNATITQKTDEIEHNNETIARLTQKNGELAENIAQKEQALLSLQEEKNAIRKEVEERQDIITQKEAEIEHINAALTKLQEESNQIQSSTDEIRELENQIQVLQEQQSDSRRETDILKSQLEQKDNEIKVIGNTLMEVNERINEFQEQLAEANLIIQNREQEIQRLRESISRNLKENVPKESIEKLNNEPVLDEPLNADVLDESVSLQPVDNKPVNTGESGYTDEQKEPVYLTSNDSEEESQPAPGVAVKVEKKQNNSIRVKSKEDEAIELSGNSIMDFPPIVNDSNKHVQRSIEYVYDKEGHIIYAKDFFGGTAEEIARKSRQLEEAGLMGKNDFVCGMCHRPIKIGHRTINGIESLFFAHANHNEYCPWIPYTASSKDNDILIDDSDIDIDTIEQGEATKPHSRVLKEMIFSLLCTQESKEIGIADVKCDAIIRSKVPYTKWRRPDISFKYKDKDIVIILQRKKHDLRMLVDRDVFFRLNNHHVIWIFGADNDVSYDYMRGSNFKNTLFDCHRNVFVFDKEAQQKSEDKNTLCLKYNWLDENDNWAATHSSIGSNGFIADITDFIFDDEYCKPYIKEANEPYFRCHPEAKEQFLETCKSKEQLMKEFEEKWKGEPSYKDALRVMKLRNDKATPFQYMGLWGFRFNTTTLIQPIFTEQPEDLHNGFFMVKQGETAGLVNYYGEVVMNWTILECEKLFVDVSNSRVLFETNRAWGVADFNGKILIMPQFVAINPWSDTIYRVRTNNLWGLQNIEDQTIANCRYNSIGELISGHAEATLRDKDRSWITYKGLIDSNGNVIDSNKSVLDNKYTAFEQFEKWGVRTIDGQDVIMPSFEAILPWTEESVKVKNNGKWGVIGLPKGNVILAINYDSIGELEKGRAKVTYVGVSNIVDANGKILSEETIKLQNGFVKSKIGGKWGIEKDGNEIVPHKYDEIGSFRRRLIGVLNSSIVKLNAYYNYPILISGRCSSVTTKGINIDIAGITCYLPNPLKIIAGLDGKIKLGSKLNNIAFANLIFSQKRYLLRFVSDAQMSKEISHGDKDSDFSMNEIVTGTITNIMRYKKQGGNMMITKVKLKLSDGRETMVPRRFFIAVGLDIASFTKGDVIQIQKTGFDDDLDQTTWRIKTATHNNSCRFTGTSTSDS